jgi:uncharacterized membrane protein YfcA
MTSGRFALLLGIGVISLWYVWRWVSLERAAEGTGRPRMPRPGDVVIGFVALFFDTLGIGAFAPTTAVYKIQRRVADEEIPGTMNVGNALPAVTEAMIFISVVTVDFRTMISMILASAVGAVVGVRVVARLPRRAIQLGMGFALLVAALLFLVKNLHLMPAGGDALGLYGAPLVLAVGVSFALGAVHMLGVGFFAPCLILLSLLGMNPLAAFPIMMGATAFLLPIGGASFIRSRRYDIRAALGLTLGGIPGVLVAAFVVKSLPVVWLRWLVVVVATYAAALMFRSAYSQTNTDDHEYKT